MGCKNFEETDNDSTCNKWQIWVATMVVDHYFKDLRRSEQMCKVIGTMKSSAHFLKCISPPLMITSSSWICRTFVTATRPSEKLDKETCEKIKEAAEAITEGIRETRQTGQFLKETVTADAGKVISSMAKKAIELASDEAEQKEKGTWEKVKQVIEKVKGNQA